MTGSTARQWPPRAALFVPATRPHRTAKAAQSGAVAVVIDLEDAVGPEEKDAARQAAMRTIGQLPQELSVVVRTNAPGTADGPRTCLRSYAKPRGRPSSSWFRRSPRQRISSTSTSS
jgi:HpcH/HpaI aldolase/citrate lyase family